MQEYIDLLNQFIANNQEWAGPITGLLCFGESLIIIGLMIPATAILIFTGALIGVGTLDPWPILIWGFIGSIIGDTVSYYIGRSLGWEITRKPVFLKHRGFFIHSRLFFKKYGTLSVFFGRFMGPVRSTMPTVAGIMNLEPFRFQLANFLSALVWLPVMLATGFFSAKGTQAIAEKSHSSFSEIFTIFSVISGIGLVIYLFWPHKTPEKKNKRHRHNTAIKQKDSHES